MICLPGLPQGARQGWNGCVDEELRRELLARREEDQRIRNLASPPQGQYMARLPDEVATEWQRIDEENTRWLGELLSARVWPARTLADEEGTGAAWLRPSTLTVTPSGSERSCMPCAAQSIRERRRRRSWPTWRTGCGSMLASRSCTALSSPSPTENSGPAR